VCGLLALAACKSLGLVFSALGMQVCVPSCSPLGMRCVCDSVCLYLSVCESGHGSGPGFREHVQYCLTQHACWSRQSPTHQNNTSHPLPPPLSASSWTRVPPVPTWRRYRPRSTWQPSRCCPVWTPPDACYGCMKSRWPGKGQGWWPRLCPRPLARARSTPWCSRTAGRGAWTMRWRWWWSGCVAVVVIGAVVFVLVCSAASGQQAHHFICPPFSPRCSFLPPPCTCHQLPLDPPGAPTAASGRAVLPALQPYTLVAALNGVLAYVCRAKQEAPAQAGPRVQQLLRTCTGLVDAAVGAAGLFCLCRIRKLWWGAFVVDGGLSKPSNVGTPSQKHVPLHPTPFLAHPVNCWC
jgi:hypothetical protein